MTFLFPIWLVALFPYAGVVAWALLSRGRRVEVPFVELWRTTQASPRPKTQIRRPPAWVVALLSSAPLAIFAASGPVVNPSIVPEGATIIVDRGITMSAGTASTPRYVGLIDRLRPNLDRLVQAGAKMVVLPRDRETVETLDVARAAKPTAVDTKAELQRAIQEALLRRTGPVVVLSDATYEEFDRHRVVWLRPATKITDVGIERFALTDGPQSQLLVRLRNQSDQTETSLTIKDEGWSTSRLVRLPARGGSIDVFVDLPAPTGVLHASIDSGDDLPANNDAYLAQVQSRPTIEPRSTLPPEVARMIDVYRRSRGTSSESTSANSIVVVDSLFRLPAGVRGVGLLSTAPDVEPITADAPIAVEDHPLTRDIDWRAASLGGRAPGPPGEGWLPLVSTRGRVLLAAREMPVRQVWVGLTSDTFPRTPDFVILWTKIFDWLSGTDVTYTSQVVGSIGPEEFEGGASSAWRPGVARTRAGRLVALNAPTPDESRLATMTEAELQMRISSVAPTARRSYDLRLPLLLASLLACVVAWRCVDAKTMRPLIQLQAKSDRLRERKREQAPG